jgi:tRNA-modifying protein YgfZ
VTGTGIDTDAVTTADPPDEALAAHYGDPLREQREMIAAGAIVDRGNRSVLTITGPDRLSWLHDITSQHLANLPAMSGAEALVLSPHGHVEHHLMLLDDGQTTWLDVEPGTADALIRYLNSMRFLLRVAVADVTAEWAVATVVGPVAGAEGALSPALAAAPAPGAPAQLPATTPGQPYPVARLAGGGFARRLPPLGDDLHAVDLLLPRGSRLPDLAKAGLWAYDALRIEAARPRLGIDTDSRTLPHEVGWIGTAVHLDKGCYRGQETVARVHNLGRPPRRLVVLHLDGSAETLPARASAVSWRDRGVGFVGTTARHHELGPVALAVIKRSMGDDAELLAGGVAARIDHELSLVPSEPLVTRDRLRIREP